MSLEQHSFFVVKRRKIPGKHTKVLGLLSSSYLNVQTCLVALLGLWVTLGTELVLTVFSDPEESYQVESYFQGKKYQGLDAQNSLSDKDVLDVDNHCSSP